MLSQKSIQNTGVIYKLTNKVNGKVYIGQTWNLKERIQNHFCRGNGCRLLFNAIKKYGRENFLCEMLSSTYDQKKLNELEKFFISEYNSNNRNFGYNLRDGGANGKLALETIEKIREKNKGYYENVENRRKRSYENGGKPFYSLNIMTNEILLHYTPMEASTNLSLKAENIKYSLKSGCSTNKIYYFSYRREFLESISDNQRTIYAKKNDLLYIFKTIYHASNILKIPINSINNVLLGKFKTVNFWHISYTDISDFIDPNVFFAIRNNKIVGEYYTISDAERDLGISKGQIFRALNKKSFGFKDYIFIKKQEQLIAKYEYSSNPEDKIKYAPEEKKKIFAKKDNIVLEFVTANEASKKLGINAQYIRRVLRGVQKNAGLWYFSYNNLGNFENSNIFYAIKNNIIVGKFYSKAEASRKLNIDSSTIVAVLKKRRKIAGGIKFIYQEEQNKYKYPYGEENILCAQ